MAAKVNVYGKDSRALLSPVCGRFCVLGGVGKKGDVQLFTCVDPNGAFVGMCVSRGDDLVLTTKIEGPALVVVSVACYALKNKMIKR